jgi:hypothetical protein
MDRERSAGGWKEIEQGSRDEQLLRAPKMAQTGLCKRGDLVIAMLSFESAGKTPQVWKKGKGEEA